MFLKLTNKEQVKKADGCRGKTNAKNKATKTKQKHA